MARNLSAIILLGFCDDSIANTHPRGGTDCKVLSRSWVGFGV